MKLFVWGVDFDFFYDSGIGAWNGFDSVVFCLFLFNSYNHRQILSINTRKINKQYILYCILELFRQCGIFLFFILVTL